MIVTIDFETFYSQEYSLRKMSEVDYILSPLFETILCAIKLGDAPVRTYRGHNQVAAALRAIDWDNVALLCHNTRFDGAILAWLYDITPRLYLDTMSMARAVTHAELGSSSLEAVAKHFKLPPKGDEVTRTLGMRLDDFSEDHLQLYEAYCVHDTELCRTIFDRFMAAGFPKSELKVIDLSLRMFIEPQVRLDATRLSEHLNLVRAEKAQALGQVAHLDKSVFSSNQKFAALLQDHGVEVPRKISPTTGEETWALARGDRAFKELCADPEQPPIVQTLLACRIGVKSTIEETRTATMLNLSFQPWPGRNAGWMPVPYRYYGAHTGRFSGDGGYNFANLKRGSPIRAAIEAPDGYRIVHRDSSQIECRMLAWLAGCEDLLSAFREGRDVYSEFASRFYGRTVTKADALERFVGKTSVLGLGYGCGWVKFRHVLFIGQGGVSVALNEQQADDLVDLYRKTYEEVPQLWSVAGGVIKRMIERSGKAEIKAITVEDELLRLPNGMALKYPGIHYERSAENRPEAIYNSPRRLGDDNTKRIYGPKLIENVCQALARIVITDVMLEIEHTTGVRPFMSTYDSHDYCVPQDTVEGFNEVLEWEFSKSPAWAPELPLASEGGFGRTLWEAEKGVNQ